MSTAGQTGLPPRPAGAGQAAGGEAFAPAGLTADAAAAAHADRGLQVDVLGIGLLGPGLPDWAGGQALLRDPAGWSSTPTAVPPPARLPPTERRRAGTVVKAALVVADQAVAMSGLDAASLPTVFTSSTGDPVNCHLLCEALAAPERMVSPTRFTNSVHNAAAGYWHIAVSGRAPSTSLAAFDASFAAGLLEAAVQAVVNGRPVLLVAADVPYPQPLHAKRPLPDTLAVALVLAPSRDLGPAAGGGVSRLGLQVVDLPPAGPTPCLGEGLEALRHAIPAARALPLLQALAGAAVGRGGAAGPHTGAGAGATATGTTPASGPHAVLVIEGLPEQSLHITLEAASALDTLGPD
jgi:hypothetical protein